jgi:hypothetical protein
MAASTVKATMVAKVLVLSGIGAEVVIEQLSENKIRLSTKKSKIFFLFFIFISFM